MRSTGMSGMGVIQPASPRSESRKPSSGSRIKLAAVGALAEAGGQQFGGDQVVDGIRVAAFGLGGEPGQL